MNDKDDKNAGVTSFSDRRSGIVGLGHPAYRPKNKVRPTPEEIDWRQLTADECWSLYNSGSLNVQKMKLKTIIDRRKQFMHSIDFNPWYIALCSDANLK